MRLARIFFFGAKETMDSSQATNPLLQNVMPTSTSRSPDLYRAPPYLPWHERNGFVYWSTRRMDDT